jgi:outer membrane protein TolC
VQIGLVADVATAWLTLAADQARLQLARTRWTAASSLELTQRMHELGSTSGLVLAQNQTTVDTARGDVASYTSQVDRDRNALQLLVGGPVPQNLLPRPRPWPAARTARPCCRCPRRCPPACCCSARMCRRRSAICAP